MILEVYDLECLKNLFTYTGFDVVKKEYYQFCICDWRNDAKLLWEHLHRDKITQVGFNNMGYDYTLLHHFLNHYEEEYQFMNGERLAVKLYEKSQEIIESEFSVIADKNVFIPQIDLYKIWHYNNAARRCS